MVMETAWHQMFVHATMDGLKNIVVSQFVMASLVTAQRFVMAMEIVPHQIPVLAHLGMLEFSVSLQSVAIFQAPM